MAKCAICQQRKAKRRCPTVDGSICPICCATKRGKEISCPDSCSHYRAGETYQRRRQISREVSANFNFPEEEILDDEEVAEFVGPLEMFFVERYYHDTRVMDSDIYDALCQVYRYLTEEEELLSGETEIERGIFGAFLEAHANCPDLSKSLKARAILRILKSITSSTGGVFGPRNYLEMIQSQFTGHGKWSHLFQ